MRYRVCLAICWVFSVQKAASFGIVNHDGEIAKRYDFDYGKGKMRATFCGCAGAMDVAVVHIESFGCGKVNEPLCVTNSSKRLLRKHTTELTSIAQMAGIDRESFGPPTPQSFVVIS